MESLGADIDPLETSRRIRVYLASAVSILWFALFVLAMRTPSLWKILGVAKGPTPFMDMRGLLSMGGCSEANPLTWITGSCDPWGRPWAYPTWIVHAVNLLHLSDSMTNQLGWINAEYLAICIGLFVYWSKRSVIWIALLAFSPPIFFLAERGNPDSFVLFALIGFIWLTATGRMWIAILVPPLLGVFKIYPLTMIASFNKMKYFLASVFIFFITLPIWVGDIKLVMHAITHSRVLSYGDILLLGGNTHQYFGYGELNTRVTVILALSTFFIWLAGYLLIKGSDHGGLRGLLKEVDTDPISYYLFSSGVLIYLFSYLGVSMADYKMWTLLPVVVALSRIRTQGSSEIIKIIIVVLAGIGMWGSRLGPDWVVWTGDIALFALSILLAASVLDTARVRFLDYLGRRRR